LSNLDAGYTLEQLPQGRGLALLVKALVLLVPPILLLLALVEEILAFSFRHSLRRDAKERSRGGAPELNKSNAVHGGKAGRRAGTKNLGRGSPSSARHPPKSPLPCDSCESPMGERQCEIECLHVGTTKNIP